MNQERRPGGTDVLLAQYRDHKPLFEAFTIDITRLLRDLLEARGIRVHSVSGRVKEESSLRRKLLLPRAAQYTTISDVTDICGVRIITYFSEEVNAVAGLIRSEFAIDWRNSVDKAETLSPDQFGYVSQHYVVRYSSARLALTEKKKFAPYACEVQIRSILQHAWAEIEHDLGYKTKYEIPKAFRRRFARLAGLLELADSEFCQIRSGLDDYTSSIAKVLKSNAGAVAVDTPSLQIVAQHDPLVRRIDERISEVTTLSFLDPDGPPPVTDLATRLTLAGFLSVGQVLEDLQQSESIVVRWADSWMTDRESGAMMSRGTSLFYLAYLAAARRDSDKLRQFVEGVFEGEESRSHMMTAIRETFAKLLDRARGSPPGKVAERRTRLGTAEDTAETSRQPSRRRLGKGGRDTSGRHGELPESQL